MTEALIAIIVVLGGLWAAYRRGGADKDKERKADNAKAGKAARENRDEMESQDDQRLVDILSGKLRDDKR